jgi:hypothetical protein
MCATAFAQPQNLSLSDLQRRMVERRAIEAVIWGMPAVNFDLMYQAARNARGGFNQIVYWSRPADWKNQTLTANPDAVYFMPFINTKDVGPMVLEIPAALDSSINGTVMDCWQAALEDVGPAGVDKGTGAKYVILPPGYRKNPPGGYIAIPSDTYEGYALLRSVPRSGNPADIARAVAYGMRIRIYPLSQALNPPKTNFVDAANVVFDSSIPYDLRFYQSLNRIVQNEPWLERDKAMIDQLKTLGIEKGKPFSPDPRMQDQLKEAAREANAWLDVRFVSGFPPFFEGSQWLLPVSQALTETAPTFYEKTDLYPVDARGVANSFSFGTIKHPGTEQYHLMAIRDSQGQPLDGGGIYRLHVPASAPVKQWSAAVYDRGTHTLIRNVPRPSRSSMSPDLQKNADGSVDIYFGPKAPAGKAANWVPTTAGANFEVLFRLYGPEQAFFDKGWRLPDIVKTTSLSAARQ